MILPTPHRYLAAAPPTVLAVWGFTVRNAGQATVIPDGCRDLIMHVRPGCRPHWSVSGLDHGRRLVPVGPGDRFLGYRLRPGTAIDTHRLLDGLQGRELEAGAIAERLADRTALDPAVAGALDCLALGLPVAEAARELGVTRRTLQRHLLAATGRPPVFWRQLARLRRAGRAVRDGGALAETALAHGYADQAHMSRAFRRWLGLSPKALASGAPQGARLLDPGYD